MKIIVIVTVLMPVIALMLGYTEPTVNATNTPPGSLPTREVVIYKVKEYMTPASDIVITINTFPFDMGGNRPYQIAAHGKKYRFKPEDVEQFLKKGIQLDIPSEPLPTGTWIGPFPYDGVVPAPPPGPRSNIN